MRFYHITVNGNVLAAKPFTTRAAAEQYIAPFESREGYEVAITFADQPSGFLVTDAPENYDGFGTRRIGQIAHPYHPDRDAWIVEVLDEHREWQVSRYASGLHLRMAFGFLEAEKV